MLVARHGVDNHADIRHYNIRHQLGAWESLAGLADRYAGRGSPVPDTPETTYYFQAQVTDNVDNASGWIDVGRSRSRGIFFR